MPDKLAAPSSPADEQNPVAADALIAQTERHLARNYAPLPIVAASGRGCWITDVDGRRYLDCISAYSALNQGHCHPRIIAALAAQAERLTLTSRAMHNDQLGPFCRALCEASGYEMVLPMNTGVEAVETAIKLARKWGYERKKIPPDRAEIIVCRNNFHGRSSTVVGFSSEPQYRDCFGPFSPGFRMIDFNDAEQLRLAVDANTAAFLVEPIQAEAGIIVPDPGYLSRARAICSASNVLFMLDEIQTGLSRTGKYFAFQHDAEARPDVLILGKALGGGVYPLSAVLASSDILSVFQPGDHGSTFGGNPLAAAVGRAALAVIDDERLTERAADAGRRLMESLTAIRSRHIAQVRGRGLLIGIEIPRKSGVALDFAMRLAAEGILCKDTHSQVLRLAPPLIIDSAELDWLVDGCKRVFED